MSKGYLVIAQNNDKDDYIRQAYALALSIKTSQKEINQFCLCVEDETLVSERYRHAFDYIVKIPWNDAATDSQWKIENRWKAIHMSPFDETVVLDTDMLFFNDVSYWWEVFEDKQLCFTNKVLTYRNEEVTSDYYRKTFTSNGLPNLYSALYYFKKTKETFDFFDHAKFVSENWEYFYGNLLDKTRPKHLSYDVVFSLVTKILGKEEEYTTNTGYPTFIHMKSFVQNLNPITLTEDWTQHLPTYFGNSCSLKVNNYQILGPFHYHIKEWLTDEIIEKLEKKYDRV